MFMVMKLPNIKGVAAGLLSAGAISQSQFAALIVYRQL
jgi:hypothetical protein